MRKCHDCGYPASPPMGKYNGKSYHVGCLELRIKSRNRLLELMK